MEEATHIRDGLYLGSVENATDIDFLKRKNIKLIMSVVGAGMDADISKFFKSTPEFLGIKRVSFHINDTVRERISRIFDTAYDEIDKYSSKGKHVLVHCAAGISRSATIVIMYLMRKHGMSVTTAYKYVAARRPIINPNTRFMHELLVRGASPPYEPPR
jgi:hypothetical protein